MKTNCGGRNAWARDCHLNVFVSPFCRYYWWMFATIWVAPILFNFSAVFLILEQCTPTITIIMQLKILPVQSSRLFKLDHLETINKGNPFWVKVLFNFIVERKYKWWKSWLKMHLFIAEFPHTDSLLRRKKVCLKQYAIIWSDWNKVIWCVAIMTYIFD